ncbi:MAG: RNA methyltransferase [Sphingobacteriaceae bacterium]|nr:RNA methyltransferase [Sphingobacteriaceae bacterium]
MFSLLFMPLPEKLLASLDELEGFNRGAFIDAHNSEQPISIRKNNFKKSDITFEIKEDVRWCKQAYYLKTRPSFTLDPLFHAGAYYVQEAGSMFLDFVLNEMVELPDKPLIIDMCGSPGGKSTIISSYLKNKGTLIANEVVKKRASILAQNLSKWGTSNVIVTNNDPLVLANQSFKADLVVLDAPCSGSGLFRKQPDSIDEWSEDNVNFCSSRQKRIIADSIGAIKSGGYLFYSTCSYSYEENEKIVDWLIEEFNFKIIQQKLPEEWGIIDTGKGYRFYPHLTQSEGFFCALLIKDGHNEVNNLLKIKGNDDLFVKKNPFLNIFDENSGKTMKIGDLYYFLHQDTLPYYLQLKNQLYIKKAGVCLGELKGKDVIPNHELAMSYEATIQNAIELDHENALNFLRKKEFSLAIKSSGFQLMQYKNLGLGWAKILPNRINNYLPQEFRILN